MNNKKKTWYIIQKKSDIFFCVLLVNPTVYFNITVFNISATGIFLSILLSGRGS